MRFVHVKELGNSTMKQTLWLFAIKNSNELCRNESLEGKMCYSLFKRNNDHKSPDTLINVGSVINISPREDLD